MIDAIDGKDMPNPRPEMTVEDAKTELHTSLKGGYARDQAFEALAVLCNRITALERIITVRLGPGAVPTTSIHSGRPLYDDSKERP